ncbi:copia protein [Tanacetum coccineum]
MFRRRYRRNDGNNRTIHEQGSYKNYDRNNGTIHDANAQFELKGQFLKELRDNTFGGLEHENENEHIEKVLEIVDLFHILNITQDQIMLRAFLAQLNSLGREIKKVNETVYAYQVGCELCKGPHYTKDCPFKEEGKLLKRLTIRSLVHPTCTYQHEGCTAAAVARSSTNKSMR